MREVTALVMLRLKTFGRESRALLARLESELHVHAQPQTAGFVPVSVESMGYTQAEEAVLRVLDDTDPDWRRHIELRTR